MRSTAIFVLAAAGLAAAQSTDDPNHAVSGCGSAVDDIIANCLETQLAQLASCETNDWACMCEQQNNVLTCYNNCPADPRKSAAESQKTSWCIAAKAANPSSTSSSRPVAAATTAASSSSSTGTATASQTNAMPGSTMSPQESSAAVANGVYPGVLAAVFGLVAFF